MLLSTRFCGAKVLLTPTIEKIIFLSSAIVVQLKFAAKVRFFFELCKVCLRICEKNRTFAGLNVQNYESTTH